MRGGGVACWVRTASRQVAPLNGAGKTEEKGCRGITVTGPKKRGDKCRRAKLSTQCDGTWDKAEGWWRMSAMSTTVTGGRIAPRNLFVPRVVCSCSRIGDLADFVY
jgi:hypothetical protein